jgi:hypothetical protein
LLLGIFFACTTGYVLFKDVLDGAPVTTQHVLSLAALVGALASAHMALPQLRAMRIPSGMALLVLFLASTFYVVISSGARNAETAATKTATIAQVNAERLRLEIERTKTQDMLDKELIEVDCACSGKGANCKTPAGNGNRCAGAKASVSVYQLAVEGVEAKIAKLGPTQKENAGYAHAAEVLAALPCITTPAGEIERRLKLLLPFVVVIISELAALAFLHVGIGATHATVVTPTVPPSPTKNGWYVHELQLQTVTLPPSEEEIITADAPTVAPTVAPILSAPTVAIPMVATPPTVATTTVPKHRRSQQLSRYEAECDLLTMLALGVTIESQDQLAARWCVRKDAVSRWLKDWEKRGLIPPRRTVGRTKKIGAA